MSTEPGIVGLPSVSMGKKRPNAMEWVRVFNRSALIHCELLRSAWLFTSPGVDWRG